MAAVCRKIQKREQERNKTRMRLELSMAIGLKSTILIG